LSISNTSLQIRFQVNTNRQTNDVSKTVEVEATETEGDRVRCLGESLLY
jgi:hypothetical protein